MMFRVAAFMLLLVGSASACTCLISDVLRPCGQFDKATSVFVGKVIGKDYGDANPENVSGLRRVTVTFEVIERLKGVEGKLVEVSTSEGCCTCGYEFEEKEAYVVFASGEEQLTTGMCSSTRHLRDATALLPALRQYASSGIGPSLFGTLTRNRRNTTREFSDERVAPIPGALVRCSGTAGGFHAITDEQGAFVIPNLPSSEYSFAFELAAAAGEARLQLDPLATQHLGPGSCLELPVGAWDRGRIFGQVVPVGGQKVIGDVKVIAATLTDEDRAELSRNGLTSLGATGSLTGDGHFGIGNLPPGEYKLAFVRERFRDSRQAYFYPDTTDFDQAAVFTLKQNEEAGPVQFQIPLEFMQPPNARSESSARNDKEKQKQQ